MISIGVADNQFYFKKGLASAIAHRNDMQLLWDVSSAQELDERLKHAMPMALFLGMELKGLDFTSFVSRQKNSYPAVKLIVFILSEDLLLVKELIDLGVNAILLRETDQDDIAEALHAVFDADMYFNEVVSRALLTRFRRKTTGVPVDTLRFSKSEIRVLELLADGYKTQDIATRIFLSVKTVENIRYQLKVKTGVSSSSALVVYAIRHRLIR